MNKFAVALSLLLALGACADDRTSPASSTSSSSTGSSSTTTSGPTVTVAPSTFVPTTLDAAPAPVVGVVTRTGGGSGEVLITWTQSPEDDVVSYVVERALTPGGALVEIGRATRAQVNQFPVAPFVDNTARVGYYRVSAIDRAGNRGGPSNEVCGAAPGLRC